MCVRGTNVCLWRKQECQASWQINIATDFSRCTPQTSSCWSGAAKFYFEASKLLLRVPIFGPLPRQLRSMSDWTQTSRFLNAMGSLVSTSNILIDCVQPHESAFQAYHCQIITAASTSPHWTPKLVGSLGFSQMTCSLWYVAFCWLSVTQLKQDCR